MKEGELTCTWRSNSFGIQQLSDVVSGLAQHLNWGDVVAVQAPMGTGKTTLVGALAQHLGALDAASSPTFALCQTYPLSPDPHGVQRAIRHLDLYRIKHEHELMDMGWEEWMEDKDVLTFVEWPERAADHFPDSARLLRLERMPDGMRLASLWQRESS